VIGPAGVNKARDHCRCRSMQVAVSPAPLYLFDSLSGQIDRVRAAWSPDMRQFATDCFALYVIFVTLYDRIT